MMDAEVRAELEAYARARIAADRYPGDHHVFHLFRCDACGVAPFALTIEHHTGSRQGDFKGIIWGECAICGSRKRLFSFTGAHRARLRDEKPVCRCGQASFYAGECERIEGDAGLAGFVDEGVVVGKCAHCGRKRVLAYTD
jgi:hypothetical protein